MVRKVPSAKPLHGSLAPNSSLEEVLFFLRTLKRKTDITHHLNSAVSLDPFIKKKALTSGKKLLPSHVRKNDLNLTRGPR